MRPRTETPPLNFGDLKLHQISLVEYAFTSAVVAGLVTFLCRVFGFERWVEAAVSVPIAGLGALVAFYTMLAMRYGLNGLEPNLSSLLAIPQQHSATDEGRIESARHLTRIREEISTWSRLAFYVVWVATLLWPVLVWIWTGQLPDWPIIVLGGAAVLLLQAFFGVHLYVRLPSISRIWEILLSGSGDHVDSETPRVIRFWDRWPNLCSMAVPVFFAGLSLLLLPEHIGLLPGLILYATICVSLILVLIFNQVRISRQQLRIMLLSLGKPGETTPILEAGQWTPVMLEHAYQTYIDDLFSKRQRDSEALLDGYYNERQRAQEERRRATEYSLSLMLFYATHVVDIRHQLKTILSAVSDERLRRSLSDVLRRTERIPERPNRVPTALGAALRAAWEYVQVSGPQDAAASPPELRITLDAVPPQLTVMADEEHLIFGFRELLHNALKAASKVRNGWIRVQMQEGNLLILNSSLALDEHQRGMLSWISTQQPIDSLGDRLNAMDDIHALVAIKLLFEHNGMNVTFDCQELAQWTDPIGQTEGLVVKTTVWLPPHTTPWSEP